MIHIIDYNVGNIASLVNMLNHVGYDAHVSSDPAHITSATHVILPGVGAFDHAMRELETRNMIAALREAAAGGVSVLGVCLGMQMLARSSEEGSLPGLGLLEAKVVRLPSSSRDGMPLPVPNIGWHELEKTRRSPLFDDEALRERFYFVHSYHMECENPADVAGIITLGGDGVTVAVARGNLHGVQFHPEKSHRHGMRLLKAFAEL